ncbi:unnamed protein product [Rotaria sordida]|uniref:Uncharacterized protein n=1 Tax=Rotaria sordida TaxID=392033 RepID=A0A814V6X7_9BILA|nr:unnamed protein product [Rotaria sordida]
MPYCKQHSPQTQKPKMDPRMPTEEKHSTKEEHLQDDHTKISTSDTIHSRSQIPLVPPSSIQDKMKPPLTPPSLLKESLQSEPSLSTASVSKGSTQSQLSSSTSLLPTEPIKLETLSSAPLVTMRPIQSESPTTIDRQSVLGTGYAAFQSQVELAGEIFTIDPMTRQKIFDTFDEFNIIVCGSARVEIYAYR